MYADEQTGSYELRDLLRALRRGRRQREIAAAAGVSVSLYKKLESGNARSTRLHNLIRVAEALEAQDQDRAELIRLARPDLALLSPPKHERRSVEALLQSLRSFAGELLRFKSRHEAVQKAVELVYASVQPHQVAFAFEPQASGKMRVSVSIGSEVGASERSALELPRYVRSGGLHVVEHDRGRVAYAPVLENGRRIAVLGLACGRQCEFCQQDAEILETVASMLQIRLIARTPTH